MGYHGNGTTSVCIFHYYRNYLKVSKQYISQPLTSIRKPGRYSDPSHLCRALPHPLLHRWRNHHLHAIRTTSALFPALALAAMRTRRDSLRDLHARHRSRWDSVLAIGPVRARHHFRDAFDEELDAASFPLLCGLCGTNMWCSRNCESRRESGLVGRWVPRFLQLVEMA